MKSIIILLFLLTTAWADSVPNKAQDTSDTFDDQEISSFLGVQSEKEKSLVQKEEKLYGKSSSFGIAIDLVGVGLDIFYHKNHFDFGVRMDVSILNILARSGSGAEASYLGAYVNYQFTKYDSGLYIPFIVSDGRILTENGTDPDGSTHYDDESGLQLGTGIGYKLGSKVFYLDTALEVHTLIGLYPRIAIGWKF